MEKWFYICLNCVWSVKYAVLKKKNKQNNSFRRQIMDKNLVVTAKLISRCICFMVRFGANSDTTATLIFHWLRQ